MKKNHTHGCIRKAAVCAFENLYDWMTEESDAGLRKFIAAKTLADIVAEGESYKAEGMIHCDCLYENGLRNGEVVQHTHTYKVVFQASDNAMYSVENFITGDMEWIEEIDGEYKIESYQDHSFSVLSAAVDYAVLALKAAQNR